MLHCLFIYGTFVVSTIVCCIVVNSYYLFACFVSRLLWHFSVRFSGKINYSKVFETSTTKDQKIGLICSTSMIISTPSQSRRDFLERIIGASSATNALQINRNTNVFQTASRAKL